MNFDKIFSEHNKSLLRELVLTDFKLRYQGSWFGYLWSIMKPLALFTVLYLVFSTFLRFGDGVDNYPVYLLLGIVIWTYFVETTTAGLHSIVDQEHLVRKVNLPKWIIVLSSSLSAFINFLINLLVVVVFMVITGVEVSTNIVYLPLIIAELFIFSASVSFILSALYVKFRDMSHIWELLTQVAFYVTPIIYPLVFVYSEFSEYAAKLLLMNPMAQIIQDARYAMITTKTDTVFGFVQLPFALIPYFIVGLTVVVAIVYFRKSAPKFAEDI